MKSKKASIEQRLIRVCDLRQSVKQKLVSLSSTEDERKCKSVEERREKGDVGGGGEEKN